ncbi:hypothetical protein X737_38560 [Mesorhizobium sp. L48C026A00]|nr:hypothetical protein X737_38560 [Mesorhizobium sp. L48C026A00]
MVEATAPKSRPVAAKTINPSAITSEMTASSRPYGCGMISGHSSTSAATPIQPAAATSPSIQIPAPVGAEAPSRAEVSACREIAGYPDSCPGRRRSAFQGRGFSVPGNRRVD